MKTPEMIESLSKDLKIKQNFYLSSVLLWSGGTTFILALFFFIIPLRADLGLQFTSLFFQGETLVLLALFFVSTWLAYRSAIPGLLSYREERIGWILTGLFLVMLVSQISAAGFLTEFQGEIDFYRGRCGPIFLLFAGLQTALGVILARRGAPTHLVRTGVWLGLSSGALGLLALQMICEHENFLHLLMWHAMPLGVLVGASAALSRRLLRW